MATKLTKKQTEKLYSVLTAKTQAGDNVTDLYFDQIRLSDKLMKLGAIEIIKSESSVDNRFKLDGENEWKQAVITNKGIELIEEIFGADFRYTLQNIALEMAKCHKCNGKGYIREYGHVAGGVCFECNGTGKA